MWRSTPRTWCGHSQDRGEDVDKSECSRGGLVLGELGESPPEDVGAGFGAAESQSDSGSRVRSNPLFRLVGHRPITCLVHQQQEGEMEPISNAGNGRRYQLPMRWSEKHEVAVPSRMLDRSLPLRLPRAAAAAASAP